MSLKENKAGSTASLKESLKDEEGESGNSTEEGGGSDVELKLKEAEEKANQSWERMLRMQAEADNLKRRAERDIENAHKYALEKFALELLPIIDSLERAVQSHINEDASQGSLLDGVSLTLKMFYAAMEKFGIVAVDPQGESFNPEWHQAVSMQIDNDATSNTVINVLQKGYLLNNRLIRPALVIVAK